MICVSAQLEKRQDLAHRHDVFRTTYEQGFQPKEPNASPSPYVTTATMIPIQVISRPDAHHERMVISDFSAPTAKCATRLIPNEPITASRPPEKKNGMIGTNAPIAVEMPADKAAVH